MVDRAERIRSAIQEKGLSYSELERITGVSKSALQRYASGETKKIPVDVIEKIASATGVSARYLMGWDESETSVDATKIDDVYLSFARDAQDQGINPDDIRLAIETIKNMRNKKKP